ncbi:MAG: CbiX/SirB N-terminal domain-containing protein [Betaproteobacteria bacterium]
MSKNAVILIAHGARDPEWAVPMRRVWVDIQAQRPGQRVDLAFLDFMKPNLLESAATLVAEGVERITIVPLFLAQGGHLKNDIRKLIDELRQQNPQVNIEITGPVGESEVVIRAMTAHVLSIIGQ